MFSSEKRYVDEYIIIFGDKVITKYITDVYATGISLDNIMSIAKSKGYKSGVLTVILETMMYGEIYQYGNYGEWWVKHGKTNGLA